jgi:hypothetical protein
MSTTPSMNWLCGLRAHSGCGMVAAVSAVAAAAAVAVALAVVMKP